MRPRIHSYSSLSIFDGTYQGKGEGFRGEVTIELTIFEGKIVDIVVVSYEDDDKYFERAARAILTDVKEMQDGNVDAVSEPHIAAGNSRGHSKGFIAG